MTYDAAPYDIVVASRDEHGMSLRTSAVTGVRCAACPPLRQLERERTVQVPPFERERMVQCVYAS